MIDKGQYADRFMQEKGAFIRTSNLYDNNDPMKINIYEHKQPIKSPGPAFETSFTNKYNQDTSFASDKGRIREQLNINQQQKSILEKAEKSAMFDDLKDTNIKFIHPEFQAKAQGTKSRNEQGKTIAALADHRSGQTYFIKNQENTL